MFVAIKDDYLSACLNHTLIVAEQYRK